jgi:hypothetical protein
MHAPKRDRQSLTRRSFLRNAASAPAVAWLAQSAAASRAVVTGTAPGVAILGGGLGGCAAALSALKRGQRVVMTEETAWIGGQVTSQAVPPDENAWVETVGATALYQDYRRRVRDFYRRNYPLTEAAKANPLLNPGNGWVSGICHEPRVSLAVLHEILAPYTANGQLTLLLRHKPVAADTGGDRVTGVIVRDLDTGQEIQLEAAYFLDVTETGEVLPLAGVEYVTGAESQAETGEQHAATVAQPAKMQAMTWCFMMDYTSGVDHTIEKPREYDFWRDYVPNIDPPWCGPLLSLRTLHPHTMQAREMHFDPTDFDTEWGWWKYRRILDARNFEPGFLDYGVCLVNWPQNDYLLGNPFECSDEEARNHLERARQLSLSLFYWLQTEAPRPDGGMGWAGLRLRGDLTGTTDGLAMSPYIRESRRIRSEFTVTEDHVGQEARSNKTGGGPVAAESFHDTVGIGHYRIDLHPSTGGDNYIDIPALPFQIPLGALIPRRVENLLAACKNLGTTHITNGCYRLHPVEWNIGEAAGALAAYCIERSLVPRQVRNDAKHLAGFQRSLESQGVRLSWPEEICTTFR